MQTIQRYFFKKEGKLKSRKLIDQIFAKGKSFSIFPFKIIWLPANEQASLQTGVGVSSKNFKKAVDRNRIKRLMREAYRLQKNELEHQLKAQNKSLSIFILYIGKEVPDYDLVFPKFTSIISRMIKLVHENTEVGL